MTNPAKEATLADMTVIHENYDNLMTHGSNLVKAVVDILKTPNSTRKGTKFIDADDYEVRFTCFSIPLLLRVEFDIPGTEKIDEDDVQGDLVLYQCVEDDDTDLELERFDFVRDLDKKPVNLFKYNARGYVTVYEPLNTPEARGWMNDKDKSRFAYFRNEKEFPTYFLDKLEKHIALSGIRVIPK